MWSPLKKLALKNCALLIDWRKRGLDSEEMLRKSLVISELETAILQEEISWKQKSRVLCLKEGDKCTKFLHRFVNSNKRFNRCL